MAGTICHLNKIREDLYLLSLLEPAYQETRGINLKTEGAKSNALLSCKLIYKGYGTKKLEIELHNLVLPNCTQTTTELGTYQFL